MATASAGAPTVTPAPSASATISASAPTMDPVIASTPFTSPIPVTPTNVGQPVTGGDKAEFVADVTVPDGTSFSPGESFTKTWRLKNAGLTTWNTSYQLVFVTGEQMGGPTSVPLTGEVAPNATVDISVPLIAPNEAGSHIGYWNLRSPTGQLFGVGANGNEAVWVTINVGAGGGNAPTLTPGPSPTPGSGAGAVTDVILAVDNANATTCPHTFTFSGQITLSKAATVTYRLEAGAGDAGFEITLPQPVTTDLDAGTHTVVYTLDFGAAVNGWARLHVTAPNEVASGQAAFTLVCQ